MTTAQTPLHQECADFATSLRSASSVAMTTKGAAPPSFLRAADLFECAAAELLRLHAVNERLRAELEARKPLPPARVDELMAEAGYLGASAESRADFISGLRHGEGAHGITGGSS